MALLREELVNFSFKGWLGLAGTLNRDTAPSNAAWYEELFTNSISVLPNQLLSEFGKVPPAVTETDATNNANAQPTIIKAWDSSNPIHLTPLPGNKAFAACEVYGDLQTRLYNFIMPQQVPRTDSGWEGYPSIGYTIKLYNGNPASGGIEITTTINQQGAVVGWFPMYGAGLIITADSFTGITDPTDVWITGYQYIGLTGGGSAANGNVVGYTQTFTNTNLVSNILTVNHNLNAKDEIVHITIKDNNNRVIEPDDINIINANTIKVDFGMITPIPGNWTIIVTCIQESIPIQPPLALNKYINGTYINEATIN